MFVELCETLNVFLEVYSKILLVNALMLNVCSILWEPANPPTNQDIVLYFPEKKIYITITMKTNRIFMILSITIVIFWLLRRSDGVEKLEGTTSKAIIYTEDTAVPNPFILRALVEKQTSDEKTLTKIMDLANEGKREELLKVLKKI